MRDWEIPRSAAIAFGVLGVGLSEARAHRGQAVETGCDGLWVTGATHVGCVVLVGHNEENIRLQCP